jgi:hypothetical protein
MAADGFARIIPISLGSVRMRAHAVAPERLAQHAIQATKILRHECHLALMMATMSRVTERCWSRKFDKPIPLPRRRQLALTGNAARFRSAIERYRGAPSGKFPEGSGRIARCSEIAGSARDSANRSAPASLGNCREHLSVLL